MSNDIPDLVPVDAGGSTGEGLKVETGHRRLPCMVCLLSKTTGLLQWGISSLLRDSLTVLGENLLPFSETECGKSKQATCTLKIN